MPDVPCAANGSNCRKEEVLNTKITILYERLSREDGEDKISNSIQNQRALLEEYAERNGLVPYISISDDGYSGTNYDRPGLSIKIISRGKGKSAVAAAAYRAGETITNEYDGITHDYTRKSGIVYTEILLPENAPHEFQNRGILWNSVERIEKQKNSQLSREIELALPVELTREQNTSLVCGFVKQHFVDVGMCADIAVHNTGNGNPHAHVMLTMRPLNEDGSWGAKVVKVNGKKTYPVDWDNRSKAEEWRKAWENAANAELRANGFDIAIDHRSFERQGIEQIPTVHMGVAATQMERKGIRTERGNRNREIGVTNKELRQLKARIKKCKDWLYSIPLENAPTMAEMMKGIQGGQNLKSRWKRIADVKMQAKVLIFIQRNNIAGMNELADKVSEMHKRIYDVSKNIKSAERRLTTLDEHLAQSEIIKQHRTVYQKYGQLDPKKKNAFYNKHSEEIRLYESAKSYFEKVMNGREALPIKKWKAEHERLTADKFSLFDEYYRLKDEVRNVEVLRRDAENLMSGVEAERQLRNQEYGIGD